MDDIQSSRTFRIGSKELERNNWRNAFFNSNEIMEQRMELFKYSVKIESSYFAAGTKSDMSFPLFLNLVLILAKGEKTLGFCDWLVVTMGIVNYRYGSLMEKKKKQ
jgi:hypothetical protein